jgi:hypothetical protein
MEMEVQEGFIDHGIPVQADEERTAAFCSSKDETRLVIAAKGFVLIINPDTGTAKQVFFPDGNKEYPFSSFSSNGLFYTGAGQMLLVLDPFLEEFIFHTVIDNGEEIVGFSFAEDKAGYIYFTSYPHCHLLRYCPKRQEVLDYGSMDATEKYPGSAAVDYSGWVYIGIGTEHKNIVAFHPESGERRSLVPEIEREKGAGYVYLGTDGEVYGHWEAADLKEVNKSSRWIGFFDGRVKECSVSDLGPSRFSGTGFKKVHKSMESVYKVPAYSLSEGYVDLMHKETGALRRIEFSYQSDGACLSTLVKGPDGHLYGTSMHPLQFFRYDFSKNQLTNFGGEMMEQGGGGNIAAYAAQGSLLIGAAYAGGKLYTIDTEKTFIKGNNPRLILQTEEIHRPRCSIAVNDGKHIIWGGFPGYGMVGGGLGIYNTVTEQNTVLSHNQVVSNQSTVSLGELGSGLILGGTSIDTPGGASSAEKDARLYLLDFQNQRIADIFIPVKGTREIAQIYIDPFDQVHCLTDKSLYFVCNPMTHEVHYRKDLSRWGSVVRNGFVFDQDSRKLLILLTNTLLSVELDGGSFKDPIVVRTLPEEASSGVVLHNGRVFYGGGSHLCSIKAD